jgi:hypothetical protein
MLHMLIIWIKNNPPIDRRLSSTALSVAYKISAILANKETDCLTVYQCRMQVLDVYSKDSMQMLPSSPNLICAGFPINALGIWSATIYTPAIATKSASRRLQKIRA